VKQYLSCLIVFLTLFISCASYAQLWKFIKEKDNIRIYSRSEAGKTLKSFKGVTDINFAASKVFSVVENVNDRDWWDKNLNQINVLSYEKNKQAQYYLIYKLPWPLKNRDLCVMTTISASPAMGEYKFTAGPLSGVIPEKDDLIRIKTYKQIWIIKSLGKNITHIELEYNVDPAGIISDWLLNMILVDTPINIINSLKKNIEKIK
jgi:hypothetical protein